jgi:spore germination cell wall hydrolase CwlJ-like protein
MYYLGRARKLAVLWGILSIALAGAQASTAAQAGELLTNSEQRLARLEQTTQVRALALNPKEWGSMRELNPVVFRKAELEAQTGCLAIALYHEARGEDEMGQIAVAQVIINRVKSRKYPDTICRVVYQNTHKFNRCQFSFACDGRSDGPRISGSWRKIADLAKTITCQTSCGYHIRRDPALARLAPSFSRASHYHAARVTPYWSKVLDRSGRIGRHIFYVSKRVWS